MQDASVVRSTLSRGLLHLLDSHADLQLTLHDFLRCHEFDVGSKMVHLRESQSSEPITVGNRDLNLPGDRQKAQQWQNSQQVMAPKMSCMTIFCLCGTESSQGRVL